MNISPIKRVHAIHKVGFTFEPPIGLDEYRQRFPRTDSVPTLTQLGLIGLLMERRRQKSARREKRRLFRQQLLRALIQPFAMLGRARNRSHPLEASGDPAHGTI
jgi:hypothetical protein